MPPIITNFLILKVWTAVERSSMEYRWKGSSHFNDQEEAALEADFLVIYCWGVWVQITMPIHYSELQKGKTKHVSPVSPCPSSEVHRRAGREASTGGRIHTLSFQTIPAIPYSSMLDPRGNSTQNQQLIQTKKGTLWAYNLSEEITNIFPQLQASYKLLKLIITLPDNKDFQIGI